MVPLIRFAWVGLLCTAIVGCRKHEEKAQSGTPTDAPDAMTVLLARDEYDRLKAEADRSKQEVAENHRQNVQLNRQAETLRQEIDQLKTAHAALVRAAGALKSHAVELEAANALRRSLEGERSARVTLEARVTALEHAKNRAETQVQDANRRANDSKEREKAVRAELDAVRREVLARDESVGELQRLVLNLIERERENSTSLPVRPANYTRKDFGSYTVFSPAYSPATSSPSNVTEPRGWSAPRRDPNRPDFSHSSFRGR